MPHLEWMTRNEDLQAAARVPYRLLEEVPELSYTAKDPATENMLIQGDNLEALKSLLPFYAGQVKCIFIDPPYNTRSAFEHYDDNLEHTQWLAMMVPRLELLREFLREDGSIWVTIDDNEAHYLKVVMDEVFGRLNFITNTIWEKSDSPKMDSRFFSSRHDHILVFGKAVEHTSIYRLKSEPQEHYNKIAADGRKFYTKPLRAMGSGEDTRQARPSMYFEMLAPDGSTVFPRKPDGSDGRWRWGPEKVQAEASRIEWLRGRSGWVPYFRIFEDTGSGRPPETIWSHLDVGSNRTSKAEAKAFTEESDLFTTPKPEAVVMRALQLSTIPGDIVLDSFLGSGTTAAVAAKMGRRYIGIELGGHAVTHCAPRLRKVVDGEQGGISESVGWKGGGGFRFYRLGKTIFDEAGQLDPAIRFASLAAHVWFSETRTPWRQGSRGAEEAKPSPFLGVYGETAYYLLYNGVLGDKRPGGGNVITRKVLAGLPGFREHEGPKVIYGESSRLGAAALKAAGIVFKQTPYDVRAR